MGIFNANKAIEDVGKFADDSFESGEERQKALTERLRIDSSSPFKLPHLVRPIVTLTLLFFQLIIFVAIFFGIEVPESVVYEVGALNGVAIGFYFNSRKAEKVMEKKAIAAIKVEEIKVKEEVRKEKVAEKINRKESRRTRRANRKD